jgi:hypothetical protein
MWGWERGRERLPPGYRLDTSDPAIWALRRPDGTATAYFSAWSASRESVEQAARDDDNRRRRRRTSKRCKERVEWKKNEEGQRRSS